MSAEKNGIESEKRRAAAAACAEKTPSKAYRRLVERFQRIARIDHAVTFLEWDQLVMMPPGGSRARAEALAELAQMRHELLTAPDTADLLKEAGSRETDTERIRSTQEMARVWREAACLPADLVKAKSLAGSKCEHAWRTQRRENDWPGFLKNFREVVNLSRQEARARQAAAPERFATPYDAMLDLYSPGDDSRFIAGVFAELKQKLPQLLQRVLDRRAGAGADLAGRYPVDAQERLNRELMRRLGFDFDAGRLDVSLHPFSTGVRGDHRITTRFREEDFADALMATAHETGHASYESGLPEKWEGLPIGQARNMSLHESQSLFFEKHVYLSRAFTRFFAGFVHEHLPASRPYDAARIWAGSVAVRPSLIRVEADEVTYPLHVILRFEIESGLIDGTVAAEDIPALWDEKMRTYLGLSTAGNHRDGCLQDIHWTDGSFGYFPAYTLGALNAAQFAAAMDKDLPKWRDLLAEGDVRPVRQWLGERVWRKGASTDARDLIRTATGEETSPRHLLSHLEARYLEGLY